MRWRVTVRGDSPKRVELRGYMDEAADVAEFAKAVEPWGIVIISPEDDGYDPFKRS